jgi:hypothetical protein
LAARAKWAKLTLAERGEASRKAVLAGWAKAKKRKK